MNTIALLRSLVAFPVAVLKWVYRNIVAPPESGEEQVPPIRYDGDPRDIYLA